MKCLKFYKNETKKRAYIRRWKQKYNKDKYPKHFWTISEIKLVLSHTLCDRDLSKKLQVSINSIQIIRWRYKNKWAWTIID